MFSSSKPVSKYDITFRIPTIFLALCEGIDVECDPIFHQIKSLSDSKKVKITGTEDEDNNNSSLLQVDDYLGAKWNLPKIVFYGIRNRGKTWLINQLCSSSFLESRTTSTECIAMVRCKGSSVEMIFVDTPGAFSPPKAFKTGDDLTEPIVTEYFLRDLLFSFGDVLVLVVDELNEPETAFIRDTFDAIEQSGKSLLLRRPIIVHNLQKVKSLSESNIEEQIRSLFEGPITAEIDPRNKFFWFKSPKATHVCLLDNSVPGGKEHNGYVLDFLRIRLKTSTDEYLRSEQQIGVLSQVTNSLNKILERYVRSKKGKLPPLLVQTEDRKLCIKTKEKVDRKDLTLVPYTTHWGRTGVHVEFNSSAVAPYDLVVEGDSLKMYLRACKDIEYLAESSTNRVFISGVTKLPYDKGVVLHSNLKSGPFKLDIQIPPEFKAAKSERIKPEFVDGMWILTFPKRTQSQGAQLLVPLSSIK